MYTSSSPPSDNDHPWCLINRPLRFFVLFCSYQGCFWPVMQKVSSLLARACPWLSLNPSHLVLSLCLCAQTMYVFSKSGMRWKQRVGTLAVLCFCPFAAAATVRWARRHAGASVCVHVWCMCVHVWCVWAMMISETVLFIPRCWWGFIALSTHWICICPLLGSPCWCLSGHQGWDE